MKNAIIRHCKICNENVKYLSRHIKNKHNISEQEYYDTYVLKDESEKLCRICKIPLKFKGVVAGYGAYCSAKCEMHDPAVHKKMADTYEERTGYRYNSQNPDVRNKIENTNEQRIGYRHPWQNPELRKQIVQKQVEKYGGYGFQSNAIKNKLVENYNKKHGTNYTDYQQIAHSNDAKRVATRRKNNGGEYMSAEAKLKTAESCRRPEIKAKRVKSRYEHANGEYYTPETKALFKQRAIDRYKEKYGVTILDYHSGSGTECTCYCETCGQTYKSNIRSIRSRIKSNIIPCTNCRKLDYMEPTSHKEKTVLDFLEKTYTGEINENNRRILKGKELDVYIPEKKLAIEFDGLYWHSHIKDDYHLLKTEECEKQGIQLIHIFEDEWDRKQEIVKSRLQSILGKNNRIFGRKTECKIIDADTANAFLNANHIDGSCFAEYHYGLFYNNELVSVMTFGKSSDEFVLLRFANKLYTNVIGGASKLFSHFRKDHPEIEKVISYADRRWSKGNLYEKLGFNFIDKLEPSCFILGYKTRELFNSIKDDDHSYIYDSGQLKYEWNKK